MGEYNRQYNIVVVDDHALIRRGISNILKGHPVVREFGEVAKRSQLESYLRTHTVDLLILGNIMGKDEDPQLLRSIKRNYPHTKTLLLTIQTSEQLLYQAMAAGVDGYILKSDSDHEFLKGFMQVLSGKQYISSYFSVEYPEDGQEHSYRCDFLNKLTRREKEVLDLVLMGHTSKIIASQLNVSPRTVDHHRSNALRKCKVKSVMHLVNQAVRNGYFPRALRDAAV